MSEAGWLIWALGQIATLALILLAWFDLSQQVKALSSHSPESQDDDPQRPGPFTLSDHELAYQEQVQLRESRQRAVSQGSGNPSRPNR